MAEVGRWSGEVVLETEHLLLRPWRVAEAGIHRELWLERDPRVPPHRRIDAEGRPTLADFEKAIRNQSPADIGFCGLVDSGHGAPREPELAFELLRRYWGRGYATEASHAVLDWARSSGHQHVWAAVWEWNAASRRVLEKVGFVETSAEETFHGINLVTVRPL